MRVEEKHDFGRHVSQIVPTVSNARSRMASNNNESLLSRRGVLRAEEAESGGAE